MAQRTVLVLLLDGVQSLDVTGPVEVFAGAEKHTPGSYRIRTATLDGGLTLLGRIAGDDVARTVQLGTEYDPQPPYDAGSPEKAPAHLVAAMRDSSRFSLEQAGPPRVRSSRSGGDRAPGRR
ncbi:hypothetical protein ACIQNG_17095 [Streptomyces sp. NPDC091377]|uniref:hypothetical protein n=1 Tax=Streptomyces sp. NPDC091377 TaxID=3365995 RepID=UPI00380C40C7